MRLYVGLCFVSLALVGSVASAQSAGYTWQVVDGQIVMVPSNKTQLVKPPSTPTQLPKNYGSQGTVIDLANEAAKTAKYWVEGERAARAREEAKSAARKALEGNSAKYASVPWLSDRPHDVSDENNPQLYHYKTGKPLVSDDLHEVRKAVYGPIRDEIGPAKQGASQDSPGHLRGTAIAERAPDGSITTRVLNPSDAKAYVREETERVRRQEEEYQKERALAREKAQRAYEDAEKREQEHKQKQLAAQAEAAKKQKEEAQRARDAAERERKESEARAKQLAENQKALERRYKERDEACSKGRTANCIYIDDKLTNDFDQVIKHQNTARCMQFEPGEGPKGGPCAPDAPPCMYCSADSLMRKQERWETYLALEVNTRRSLLQSSTTPLSSFESAVRERLTSSSMSNKFGMNEFILRKYGN